MIFRIIRYKVKNIFCSLTLNKKSRRKKREKNREKILTSILNTYSELSYKTNLPTTLDLNNFSINPTKPTLALQVDNLDKGGLEEVVLNIATSQQIQNRYNILIIAVQSLGSIADIATAQGIPVVCIHEDMEKLQKILTDYRVSIWHFHYSLFGVQLASDLNISTCYTIHNNYFWFNQSDVNYRKKLYSHIHSFVAVSSQVKDFFLQLFDIDPSLVQVIPNGINLPIQKANLNLKKVREKYNISEDDILFLNAASWGVAKNQDLILDALIQLRESGKNMPPIKVIFSGNFLEETYFEKAKRKIEDSKIADIIVYTGHLPKEQLMELLQASNCFILSSLTEGLSIASLEAMALGIPMILTDIGGARDCIKNNDIGIIIPNDCNNKHDHIQTLFSSNRNIHPHTNVTELVQAMESICASPSEWKEKAILGQIRAHEKFHIDRFSDSYSSLYENLPFKRNLKSLDDLRSELSGINFAIVAPSPVGKNIQEGWFSRISHIDELFSSHKRIYINCSPYHNQAQLIKHSSLEYELIVHPRIFLHQLLIDHVIFSSKFVYVHTLHLAEFIFEWLDCGKFIVDIHGVTPEEEKMMGNLSVVEKYEIIEKAVLEKALACVMVTRAMQQHYLEKYPDLHPNTIILPIVENIASSIPSRTSDEISVVYSGAIQEWQNLPSMLDIIEHSPIDAHYTFLSHEYVSIENQIKSRRIQGKKISTRSCRKNDLPEEYLSFNYGFVLRNDSPVNRVACPTKLFEYINFGILPILRTTNLGDFVELGLQFIHETDFLKGHLPSLQERNSMVSKNLNVLYELKNIHEIGKKQLFKLISD